MAAPRHAPTSSGDAAAKSGPEKARHGHDAKGIALVVLAHTVMPALSAQPVAPYSHRIETQGIAAQETAQSPNLAAI
jgi:hypothetical protein